MPEFSGFLNALLISFAVITLLVACLSIVLSKTRNPAILPSVGRMMLYLSLLSKRWLVVCASGSVMYCFIALSPASVACPLWVSLLVAGISSIGFRLGVGDKSIGMPLGHGLSMTEDGGSNLRANLSGKVLSFHVDRRIIKQRRAVTDRMISVIQQLEKIRPDAVIVLKSWLFVDGSALTGSAVKSIRKWMVCTRICFIVILLCWILMCMYATSERATVTCKNLIPFAITCAVLFLGMWLMLRHVQALAAALLSSAPQPALRDAVRFISNELAVKARGFSVRSLPLKPLSKAHLFGLSLSRKVTAQCVGLDAGLMLIAHGQTVKSLTPIVR